MSLAVEFEVTIRVMARKNDVNAIAAVERELCNRGVTIPRKNMQYDTVLICGELTEGGARDVQRIFFEENGVVKKEYAGRIFSIDWC